MRKKIQKKVTSIFAFSSLLRVLFYASFALNGFLALFLTRDYLEVNQQLRSLRALQNQYEHQSEQLTSIVHDFHRRFEEADFGTGDEDESFVLLNRDPEYLEQAVFVREPLLTTEKKQVETKPAQTALFRWPLNKDDYWISSYFGFSRKRNRFHAGIDMAAQLGTPVYAAGEGKIEFADVAGTFGSMILVSHNRQYKTRYAHLSKILVNEGEAVTRGQKIGLIGNTGRTSGKNGYHLHFEVLSFDKAVNPLNYVG